MNIIDIYKNLFGRKGMSEGNPIDMSEHGRVGGLSTGQPFKFTKDVDETVRVDSPDANTTYVGIGKIGTTDSSSGWQVFKVVKSGVVISVTYADGNDNYDNVWDDRASLSYS